MRPKKPFEYKHNTIEIIYYSSVFSILILCILVLLKESLQSDWHDFDVFYNSARAALAGENIYIISGPYNLPFWYPPWVAWFFIPFSVWPRAIGVSLYQAATIISAIFIVNGLINHYNRTLGWRERLLILSLIIPMSIQLIWVGQTEYIFLGLITLLLFAVEKDKKLWVGIIYPFLLIKPHLILVFTPALFWLSGKKSLAASTVLIAAMTLVQTIIDPGWLNNALNLLKSSGRRVDGLQFTTLPSLLGFQENWTGTANLPLSILLFLLMGFVVWKFRNLPKIPLLSLALAASLACAPRAYAYDLPLLIPAMIWLTATDFKRMGWVWFAAALIPPLAYYGTGAYLLTLLVFLLAVRKSARTTIPSPT